MNYLLAAFVGAIQGITEFLPVSSSGHLVLLHKFLELPIKNEIAFDVALHFATLIAVMYFFRKDIVAILKDWFISLRGEETENSRLGWYILVATIPAVVFGLSFQNFIETNLRDERVTVFMLFFVAIIFIVVEKYAKQTKDLKEVSLKNSIAIGFAQALALIPGTSRSGATIVTGLVLGLKREVALKFSFLMSIPVILGASIKELPVLMKAEMASDELYILITAFVFALVFGFLSVRFFMRFAKNNSLKVFAYYRLILAFILLCILFL